MSVDYFASGVIPIILSWILTIPAFFGIMSFCLSIFGKVEDVPFAFSIWIGFCCLIFSPLRYMLFQIVAATCYMVQSFSAFISLFMLAFYVPIVFSVLWAIGFGLPFLPLFWIVGKTVTKARLIVASLLLPVLCGIGSVLFFLLLPYAAMTIHWLRAEDVIRATNGPAYYTFRYFAGIGSGLTLPGYYEKTPQTSRDMVRCHVASIYLSDREQAFFIAKAYPEIWAEATQRNKMDYASSNGMAGVRSSKPNR